MRSHAETSSFSLSSATLELKPRKNQIHQSGSQAEEGEKSSAASDSQGGGER